MAPANALADDDGWAGNVMKPDAIYLNAEAFNIGNTGGRLPLMD